MSFRIGSALFRRLGSLKKAVGKFLELGTGTGLSITRILDGMDHTSTLISLDHDGTLLVIPKTSAGQDERLELVHADGEVWVNGHLGDKFDDVFADTWRRKYLLLDEVLGMIKPGAFYIVGDMLSQHNWSERHQEKGPRFVAHLECRTDLVLTNQHWSTGIIVAVKK